MSHQFIDGKIYHKRYAPKKHDFTYNFFMLDIDINEFESLNKPFLFSLEKFNLFSFYTKDHFGTDKNFLINIRQLLQKFSLTESFEMMRFITLPRISGFVFNPISTLVLYKENIPTYLLAEVHNYNNGRIVYCVKLEERNNQFHGISDKDMYVSPFFDRIGTYHFVLIQTKDNFSLQVKLYENEKKVLTSHLSGKVIPFSNKTLQKLFIKHTFLTLWVVLRTLYQTIKLKLMGLKWYSPTDIDTIRRH